MKNGAHVPKNQFCPNCFQHTYLGQLTVVIAKTDSLAGNSYLIPALDFSIIPSNKSEKFSQILQLWWLSLKNYRGISREISHNWSPRWEIFVGSQFWDSVSRNSEEFCGEKFLRISQECFSGNSWEILRTWSPCLRIFRGIH